MDHVIIEGIELTPDQRHIEAILRNHQTGADIRLRLPIYGIYDNDPNRQLLPADARELVSDLRDFLNERLV